MNRIRDFNCTKSANNKGKTLCLRRSKATLAKNNSRHKKFECTNVDRLIRPNLNRIKSIFEKERKKSKFDMIQAEKFVKLLKDEIKTPKYVKECVENKKKKKLEIDKKVDKICETLKFNKFAQMSFTENHGRSTKKLLEKLTICSDDESFEGNFNKMQETSKKVCHCTLTGKIPKFKENQVEFTKNPGNLKINETTLESPDLSNFDISLHLNSTKIHEGSTAIIQNLSEALAIPEISLKNSDLKAATNLDKSERILKKNIAEKVSEVLAEEKNSELKSAENFEKSDQSLKASEAQKPISGQFGTEIVQKDSKIRKSFQVPSSYSQAALLLEEMTSKYPNLIPPKEIALQQPSLKDPSSYNQTAFDSDELATKNSSLLPKKSVKIVSRHPSFAKNFPVQSPAQQFLQQHSNILKVVDENYVPPLDDPDSSILSENSNESVSKLTNFTVRVDQQKVLPANIIIALRELTQADMQIQHDAEIIIRVTKSNFSKIYIVRKLENEEDFREFCKSSVSNRSKLFKTVDHLEAVQMRVKRLPKEKFKKICGKECQSQVAERNYFFDISEETYSAQKLDKASNDKVKIRTLAFDYEVRKDPEDDSKFIVSKK